jgi:hypothetical protein
MAGAIAWQRAMASKFVDPSGRAGVLHQVLLAADE